MTSVLVGEFRNTAKAARAFILEATAHVGAVDLKSPNLWGILVLFSIGSVFSYDFGLNRAQSQPEIYLLIGSQVVFLAIYALGSLLLRAVVEFRAIWIAIVLFFMVIAKAWLIELAFQDQLTLVLEGFLSRLPGDLTITFTLFFLLSELNYSNKHHEQTLNSLEQSKTELRAKQIEAKNAALEVDDSLSIIAQQALSAPLDEIRNKLSRQKQWEEIRLISSEIRDLINLQVRPLSHRFRLRLEALAETRELQQITTKIRLKIPKNLNAKRDVDFLRIFMVSMPNIWITSFSLGGWLLFSLTLVLSFLIIPMGKVAMKLVEKIRAVGRFENLVLMTLMLFLSYVPLQGLYFLYSQVNPEINPLRISGAAVYFGVGMMLTILGAIEFNRRELEKDFASLNHQIARETAIVEQQVWVARKKWAYLIHGTVQGALTVAASRLQLADDQHPADLDRILQDLDKAAQALGGQINDYPTFESQIDDIRSTWEGVLDVEVAIDPHATEIVANPLTERCIAELIKELAGNAYRHGEAKKLYVAISLDERGDVSVTASNDGRVTNAINSGLGFRLFDDLTMQWHSDSDSGGWNFYAVLPGIYPRSESSQDFADA